MEEVGGINIIFITNTDRHNVSYPTWNSTDAKYSILLGLLINDVIQLDYETTGLDPYLSKLLLCSINIGGVIYVIDLTTVKLTDILTTDMLQDKLVICHNAKFEYKFSKVNGLDIENMYCTMVADQRLVQGVGLSSSLIEVCKRRKVPIPLGMDKDVRGSFIGADINSIIFTDEQILYSACDVIPLLDIKLAQDKFITQYNMDHLIYNIEKPLINVLGDNELDGFKHNSEQWVEYAKTGETKALELTKQLDELVKSYGVKLEEINPLLVKARDGKQGKITRLSERIDKLDSKIEDFRVKNKTHLKSYEITKNTWEKCWDDYYTLIAEDTEEEYVGINWSSSDQVIKVMQSIPRFIVPMSKNKETKRMEPSVGKEARSLWMSDNEDNEYVEFFKLFDTYKKTIHNVNAFGEEWVKKYVNPVTGRVHTHYFQCSTDTGRLASGDAKNGWLNIQQIPAIKELRSCFLADEGYELVTCDLAAAELRLMCSLANDDDLWKLGESGDIHSPIATNAWRAVYKSRGDSELANSYIISKTINEDIRRRFKNLSFGAIYGCHATKAATTVGVTKKEGQIILDGIKSTIPKTFSMVEKATDEVYRQGYIITNTRTNSRKWFPNVLKLVREGFVREEIEDILPFMEKVSVDGQSRNIKIQAGQADMVKETMVVIYKFNKLNKLDCTQKLQCHDELVYQYPIGLQITCPYTNELIGYAEYVSRAMINTSNLYLNPPYLMDTDYHINLFWEK